MEYEDWQEIGNESSRERETNKYSKSTDQQDAHAVEKNILTPITCVPSEHI